MTESKIKGLTTELQCQLFFTSLGYNVSVPLGEDCKYDFIVDIDRQLLRIQVKTCHQEENGIEFKTKSSYLTHQGSVSNGYTEDDIDFFATFFEEKCYLIPVNQCGTTSKKLLFERYAQKNNKKISILNDYEAIKIITALLNDENLPNEGRFELMQFTLDGQYIQSFSSYKEAVKSLGKTQSSHIGQCIRGTRKTAYGFIWKLKEEN